jgi:DNA-binding NarL/FixJ family response regulator
MHSDIRFAVEMFKAGAAGYLPKDCAFNELTFAIKTVLANKIYLSPNMTEKVVKGFINNLKDTSSVFSVLTVKERHVLQLMAEGKTRNQIAMALFISEKTVETHHRNIIKKLGIKSIAELTKYAVREGLTHL